MGDEAERCCDIGADLAERDCRARALYEKSISGPSELEKLKRRVYNQRAEINRYKQEYEKLLIKLNQRTNMDELEFFIKYEMSQRTLEEASILQLVLNQIYTLRKEVK